MAAKASSARSSDIGWDGAGNLVLSSKPITFSTAGATTSQDLGMAPFDAYLEELIISIHTAVTVSNTGLAISIGDTASTDSYLSSFLITATTTGRFKLDLSATTVLDRTVPAGTWLRVTVPSSGISSVAVMSFAAVLVPRTA